MADAHVGIKVCEEAFSTLMLDADAANNRALLLDAFVGFLKETCAHQPDTNEWTLSLPLDDSFIVILFIYSLQFGGS